MFSIVLFISGIIIGAIFTKLSRKINIIEVKNNLKQKGWFVAGIAIMFAALATPVIIFILTDREFTVRSIAELGPIGDFLGGSTVGFLSLAGILFVIHTINIQQRELEQTREEFNTGNNTAKAQKIDNAFFNMLSLLQKIVGDIVIEDKKGREAIEVLNRIFEENIAKESRERGYTQKEFDEVYRDFYAKYENRIGLYMRHNYRIVKFIVDNVIDEEKETNESNGTNKHDVVVIADKRYYFGMLRAQWSNAEFALIFFNALYKENAKFKKLILEHDVMDILDKNHPTDRFALKKSMESYEDYKSLIRGDD